MHLVWTLGVHLPFNKRIRRKLAHLGAAPERGHTALQGGYNGVTQWGVGHQDPGWHVLHAFQAKYPEKMSDTLLRCLWSTAALGLVFLRPFVLSLVPTSSEVFTLQLKK